jgi:hypothetical protein
VRQSVWAGSPFWQWQVKIRNEGQGAANIESFVVIADGDIVPYELLEAPPDYWIAVLIKLGALSVEKLEGSVLVTPVSIGAGDSHLLFHAHIAREQQLT